MSEHVKTFTDQNFETEVLKAQGPVLVDFWGPYCPPCQVLAPIIDELAAEYKGSVAVGKVNAQENLEISTRYAVYAVPTVILFKGGEIVERTMGAKPKLELRKMLDRHAAPAAR